MQNIILGLFALVSVGAAAAPGVDLARNAVSLNFYDEPKTLDPQKAVDHIAMTILGHAGEGLVRLDPANRPVAATAASWDIVDGTEYRFKIRDNARWSDGRPVVAADFVYGWQRAADPKTGSPYAYLFHLVKNGRAVADGKAPTAALGEKALDDHTLAVTLERPTDYFLCLLSMPTFQPARRDVVEKFGATYAADSDKMISNGPFVVAAWTHGAALLLKKNDVYWNKADVRLDEISMPEVVRDKGEEFARFREGKFSLTWSLTKEQLPAAAKAKLPLRRYNYGTVWYLQLNTRRGVTANVHFRKALQLAMNREEFVRVVQGIPGSHAIHGIVPEYMPGVSKRYGDEYPLTFAEGQVNAAKEQLALAKKELGINFWPALRVLASDNADTRRDMAYFQAYYQETLGLTLNTQFFGMKERLERTAQGDFDIANSGWGPDYLDAMTFADLFTSWNKNNASGWASPAYDGLIQKAMAASGAKARLDAVSAAEHLLVAEAPVIPYFQQARVYVQDPRLVGVVRRTVGADPDFYYAKLMKPVASAK